MEVSLSTYKVYSNYQIKILPGEWILKVRKYLHEKFRI